MLSLPIPERAMVLPVAGSSSMTWRRTSWRSAPWRPSTAAVSRPAARSTSISTSPKLSPRRSMTDLWAPPVPSTAIVCAVAVLATPHGRPSMRISPAGPTRSLAASPRRTSTVTVAPPSAQAAGAAEVGPGVVRTRTASRAAAEPTTAPRPAIRLPVMASNRTWAHRAGTRAAVSARRPEGRRATPGCW